MSRQTFKYRAAGLLLMVLVVGVLAEATLSPSLNNHSVNYLDKLIHFLMYGTIAWLGGYLLYGRGLPLTHPRITGVALAGTAFGVIVKLIQSYTPGRDVTVFDMIANFAGACAFMVVFRLQNKAPEKKTECP